MIVGALRLKKRDNDHARARVKKNEYCAGNDLLRHRSGVIFAALSLIRRTAVNQSLYYRVPCDDRVRSLMYVHATIISMARRRQWFSNRCFYRGGLHAWIWQANEYTYSPFLMISSFKSTFSQYFLRQVWLRRLIDVFIRTVTFDNFEVNFEVWSVFETSNLIWH